MDYPKSEEEKAYGTTVYTADKGKEVETDSSLEPKSGELKRTFSVWSVLGIGFGLTNSWFGISASLVTGIQSGGPLMIVYGIIIIAFISYNIGITLSELSSAIPSAGGQYVWTRVLSPRKYSGFLAYLCGSLAYAGSLFTSASMALSLALTIMGFWNLMHPAHVTRTWELFVVYQLVNASLVVFNCYGKYLPYIANGALYTSLFSYTVITLTVLVCARGNYQLADFVFVKFENNTGWQSAGIAFIVGLINPNWSFSCLDSASHLAEEVHNADRVIPIAILGTVTIGMVTSLTYAISMFFCVTNLDDIINNGTGLPILDIYYQALNNKAGAICLGTLMLLTGIGCTVSSHTWQARLCWSFSRDNGLPFSKYLSIVDPNLGVPLNAHLVSSVLVAILGCLYLASLTAFNSMVVGCITFLLLSYMVPTLCLLYRGRNNIRHGCFWLGNWGLFANIMTVAWTVFALVFFSLPSEMPVSASSMNYVSAVYAVYAVLAMGYWFFPIKEYSCRAHFAGGLGNNDEEEFPDVCLTDL
ncbi:amino acid transporter [Metschnikowia bicuspidata var. bicuspidata NRRL YB-4993]|uniref:Amino acid transporter n=1 Tax=Metschnikowia bicuspidata var. bicuspidata NRRL YB-4993 TaxID=869754 RepID=A0A1A0H935_9ASCO|nr:amino acid transporter [Metschnikowia bicuspidata var. bicuspidata NRRL YB-4993]OBA20392.1 amino acid transporter [Metschnikowia bicuspidata var. bicuspidata NRRL YB-4993]